MTNKQLQSKLEEADALCVMLIVALIRDNPFPVSQHLGQIARAESLIREVKEHLNKEVNNEG